MFEYSVVCVLSASYLLFSALTAGAWSSPSISKLNATDGPFNSSLTTDQSSWLGSLPTLGSMMGPILGGYLCEKLGRKISFLLYAIPISASYFILAFAQHIGLFYFARFIVGLSMGSLFALTPVYVGEMSLNEHRGILSGIIGIFVNGGTVFTLAIGPYISVKLFNLILACLPLGFIIEFLIWGLESPHYFIQKGEYDKARAVLRKIRKYSDEKVDMELKFLKHLIEGQEQGSLYDLFRSKGIMKATVMSLTLFGLGQLSGTMVIQTYSQQIFEKAGSNIHPAICSIIIAVVSLLSSTLTPIAVNFVGRKRLLISSALATAVGQILLGIFLWVDDSGTTDLSSYKIMPLVLLIHIIISSALGLVIVPVMLLSEIFPNAIKGIASNISASWSFFILFLVSKFFPILSESIGQGQCFVGFSVFSILTAVYTYFFVIETKGKTLKDILEEFNS